MPPRIISTEKRHEDVMEDFKAVLTKHKDKLSASEMLAISSQLVGQILALQDQRTMTAEAGLLTIQANIEQGNRDAIEAAFRGLHPTEQ